MYIHHNNYDHLLTLLPIAFCRDMLLAPAHRPILLGAPSISEVPTCQITETRALHIPWTVSNCVMKRYEIVSGSRKNSWTQVSLLREILYLMLIRHSR